MKILDWYILKKFLKTYVFAVFLIVLIVMVIDYTEKIDDFIRKEAPLRAIIFDYYLNFIPYWANYISPLMVFIATVFFTANMASKTEIIAILSSGISFPRLMRPYIIGSSIIAIGTFVMIGWIVPNANKIRVPFEHEYINGTYYFDKTTADYSACTTWGVFYNEEEHDQPQVILLDAFKDRMQFPELKQIALKHYKEWEPDAFVVEKKAAGAPLIQELRAMGIPVQEFSPSRGNDKIVRVNAIADLFTSGKVWAPDTRWAREVIEELAAFPVGEHDDYVDTTSQALLRFRQGGFISLDTDDRDDKIFTPRRAAYY